MQDVSLPLVHQCLGNKFGKFFYLPADGTRGGILVAWDDTVTQLSNPHYTANSLTTIVKSPSEQEWWLTCVYGPQDERDKVAFLQELVDIRDLHAGPWLVVGDFNLLVNEEDKSNALINRRMMERSRTKGAVS